MKKYPSFKRGSTLIATLVIVFLLAAFAALSINKATYQNKLALRVKRNLDRARLEANILQIIRAKIIKDLDKPSITDPAAWVNRNESVFSLSATEVAPAILGSGYKPETVRVTYNYMGATAKAIDAPLQLNRPESWVPSFRSQYCNTLFDIPVSVTISAPGQDAETTQSSYTVNLCISIAPLAQYAYFTTGFNAQIICEANTVIRGGVISNNTINLVSTNEGSNIANTQVDFLSAKAIDFNFYGRNGGSPYYTGTYINTGDVNGNKVWDIIPAAKTGNPGAYAQGNPLLAYDPISNKINFEVRPASETRYDKNHCTGPAGTPAYSDFYTADTQSGRVKIDSNNPNLPTLINRFNGNMQVAGAGHQDVELSALPEAVRNNGRALIEPPTLTNPATWTQDTIDTEKAKIANQANFYVYIDNGGPWTTQPRPLVFTQASKATDYKKAIAALGKNPSQADKDKVLADFAADIIDLSSAADVIETKRSFYDINVSRGKNALSGGTQEPVYDYAANPGDYDPAKPGFRDARVSAVDINLGKLSDLVGGKGEPLKTMNGATWDNSAWNGIMYVDVAQPMGANGWVSYDKSGKPLQYTDEGTLVDADKNPVTDPIGANQQNFVAVRIHNATTVPSAGKQGFSLATNTSVYSVGSVNADGNPATDKVYNYAAMRDPAATAQENAVPMALFCDGYTYVHNGYLTPPGSVASAGASLDNGDYFLRWTSLDTNINDAKPTGYFVPKTTGRAGDFAELNFSLYSGMGARDKMLNVNSLRLEAAKQLNFLTNMDTANSSVRFRGSLNYLFETRYNRFRNISNWGALGSSTWKSSISFDPSLRNGATPPGAPMTKIFYIRSIN